MCVASHSPYQGREVVNDEFVYEESRYPDQESPDNLAHVTLEARSASVTGGESQVIGVDDYELEEEESEVSDSNESDHDQVTAHVLMYHHPFEFSRDRMEFN